MELSTLILAIGALLIVLVLIKIALGITRTVAKVALFVLSILIIIIVLMKIGVLPDLTDTTMDDVKNGAKAKLSEITENVSLPTILESNETQEEEDSQYPPGYNQSGGQDTDDPA